MMALRDGFARIVAGRALILVAVGVAIVAVDFRTEALDLLPDPIGWVLFAIGASRLSLPTAARLGAATALLSLGDLFLDFSYVFVGPDGTVATECSGGIGCDEMIRYDAVSAPIAIVIGLAAIMGGAAVITLLERLRADPTESLVGPNVLRCLQVLVAVVWVLPVAAVVGASLVSGFRYEPFWDGGLVYVSGAATVVTLSVALAIAVYSNSTGRTLERDWSARPTRLTTR